MTALVLAAHGSVDPRSPATAHAVADQVRKLRSNLDVRLGFCERSQPNLTEVVPDNAVVAPLLLADSYHARVDIPGLIAASGAQNVRQADVLGEDPRLLTLLRDRLGSVGVSTHDRSVGVLVVAVGSSSDIVNTRTRALASATATGTAWAGAVTAFATGPRPTLDEAA
ncbi:MAG TPA: CbiX/SirB N-terminal domain-containing protein, partial [Mycobacterium sp.]|nr:CbiX/SirB N-terminal domain-containing protein [Mycobacterium sp.]